MSAAPAAPQPCVEVDDLRVDRGGVRVIDGLTVRVPTGRVVGLLGPSGCGKSTLLRSVVGVQRVAAGRVRVLGHPAGSAQLRRRVAYLTQAPSVYDDLTVRENLRYFAKVLCAPRDDVQRVLELVDLGEQADSLTSRLSGGQRSRVGLASALLGRPELLVLDEPTVGLDPLLRAQLWELFGRLAGAGATLLVSSHVMDEAARCDRLLLMREGRLLADDTVAGLLADTGATDVEHAFVTLILRDRSAASA